MAILRYSSDGTKLPQYGLDRKRLADLEPALAAARDEVLADATLWASGDEVPPAKNPLDAGFIELPDRLLADYRQNPATSEVGQIKVKANSIADAFDRVILLGIGGSYMGARAIFEGLCHPYHNDLPRPRRDRPRLYFEGNNVDNDSLASLIELIDQQNAAEPDGQRWLLVVISKSGGTLETAVAFRILLRHLAAECKGAQTAIAERVVPITGPNGRLAL